MTDKALFEYYLVSSSKEECICSSFPYYIEEKIFTHMVESSLILDNLVKRIIDEIVLHGNRNLFKFECFPLLDSLFDINIPILPFFWVRYDAFQREKGGIFFSEFNYDKPCAQRETLFSTQGVDGIKPSKDFAEKFQKGLIDIWNSYKLHCDIPTVAILVDSGHYEETHLAFLYQELLKSTGFEFIIASGENLAVENERLHAFGKEVDILLRQYPTEFLYELPAGSEILRLFAEGKLLIINDPRVIFGQTKSLFAYFWELVDCKSDFLSDIEKKTIIDTIPYTTLFDEVDKNELLVKKDSYVIKASYGRYSEEVYIGIMHTSDEWTEILEYIGNSGRMHIVQEFCEIKKENIMRFNGLCYEMVNAFGNFGIYLVNSEYAGVSVRWSTNYLSHDDIVWTSGIGIGKRCYDTYIPQNIEYREVWNKINDKAAFSHGFTGGYTGNTKAFLLESLVLSNGIYKELQTATEELCCILKKSQDFVKANYKIFFPVLGISDTLGEVITGDNNSALCFVGRFDWVINTKGEPKLLEFNSDTPAGFLESLVLNDYIIDELNIDLFNPNSHFGEKLINVFEKIIKSLSESKEIKNIGFVTTGHFEDWYNTSILFEKMKDLPYNFILGNVHSIEARDNKLYLYNTPLDAIYRYYPLEWLEDVQEFPNVIDSMKEGTVSINPCSSIITQNKTFWALIWNLLGNGFYTDKEKDLIQKYIPFTSLSYKGMGKRDFCIKPFLGREGQQVSFSFEDNSGYEKEGNDFVFQEWVDIQPVKADVYTTSTMKKQNLYPVIGVYVTDGEYAGLYTRAGSRITDKWAYYLPAYIKKDDVKSENQL